ncbi:MAG: DUF2971 domain-containing protein [Candidatus Omnitrophota bacterium]
MGYYRDFLRPVREKIIYHYTTLSTFKSILESQSLHLTHIAYLNDLTEFEDGQRFFYNRLRLPKKNKEHRDLINRIEEAEIYAGNMSNLCVFSLCAKGNLLNQWRVYGQDGFGLAIGFNAQVIRKICKENDLYFGKCFYSDKMKERACNKILGKLFSEKDNKFRSIYGATFGLFSKNKHFAEEKEIRIATNPSVEVDIKERNNRLVTFYCLNIGRELSQLIKEVVIGPCHQDNIKEIRQTINVLLQKRKIHSDIISSNIPYRSSR